MRHHHKTRHPKRAQARTSRQTFETNIDVAKQTTSNAKQALRHCLHLLRKCKIKALIQGLKRYGISLKRTSGVPNGWRFSVDSSKRSSLGNSLVGVTLFVNDDGMSMLTILSGGTKGTKSTGETVVREIPVPLFPGKSDREMSSNFAGKPQDIEGTREERLLGNGKRSLKRTSVSKLFPPVSFAPSDCREVCEGAGHAAQRRRRETNDLPHTSIQKHKGVKPNSTSKIRANQRRDLPRSLQIGVNAGSQLDYQLFLVPKTPISLDHPTQSLEFEVSGQKPPFLQTAVNTDSRLEEQNCTTSARVDAPSQGSDREIIGFGSQSPAITNTAVSHLDEQILDSSTLLNIPLQAAEHRKTKYSSFGQDLNTRFDNVLARYADWEPCPEIGLPTGLAAPSDTAGSFESEMMSAFDRLCT